MQKPPNQKFQSGSQINLKPIKLSQNHLIARRNLLASIQPQPNSLSPEKPPKSSSFTRIKLETTPNSIPSSLPRSRSKLLVSNSSRSIEKLSPLKPKNLLIPNQTQRPLPDTIPLVIQSITHRSVTGSINNKKKKQNQDSFFIIPNFNSSKSQTLLGVQDGHGTYGGQVSAFVSSKLPLLIENRTWLDLKSDYPLTPSQLENLKLSLTEAYIQTNTDLNLYSNIETDFSGTTSVTVLIRGRQCICCNCGDSRAVVGRVSRAGWSAIPLSRDHKPDLPDEKFRIEHNGGRIEAYKDSFGKPLGPARVWLKNEQLPGLAMSRSLGDKVAAKAGVVCLPEIFVHVLETNDKFVVLASDGVWEFISSDECVRIVSGYYFSGRISEAAEQIVSVATQRWNSEDGSVDDITVIIVLVKVKDE